MTDAERIYGYVLSEKSAYFFARKAPARPLTYTPAGYIIKIPHEGILEAIP